MIQILNHKLSLPIIQGGMGVGVSLGNLAGSVAACGGMGVISTVNAGYRETDFDEHPLEANLRALKQEIFKARSLSQGNGMLAINAMVAVNHYEETVTAAIKAGIQAVISGAGLPMTLPKLTKGTGVAAAPIVSSGKAASVICRTWDRKYQVIPDFMIIEGPRAGGHLGFSRDELLSDTAMDTEEILRAVLTAIAPFEIKYNKKIPVFVAGGVFNGADMAKMTVLGASGVQIATRFIATKECDASEGYKQRIVAARLEDAIIVKSPVGMPGRALNSPLLKRLDTGEKLPAMRCNLCLKACPHGEATPYCISRALIEAVKGNWEDGLFFCGSNVGRINQITTVKDLMTEITTEWKEAIIPDAM
ncbi:MAG: nitronate monooxygenase family protein [Lachnospiraceae bacterium]|nr:nitronate monooxygenase family protein [Lachnospiraceae bacterium]